MVSRWKQRVQVFEFVYMALIQELSESEIKKMAFEDYIFNVEQLKVIEEFAEKKDTYIEKLSQKLKKGWTWKRISAIEQALLLEALIEYEILKTPKKVIIDQTIITAKRYGEEDIFSFINGILNQVIV